MYQYKLPRIPVPPPPFRINQFAGLNQSVTETQLKPNESPDMKNCRITLEGKLEKRNGYQKLYNYGTTPINGIWDGILNGEYTIIVACGGLLYKHAETPTEIATGLNDAPTSFFVMNDKLYIMDGINYKVYDGITVEDVESNAYIPTFTRGGTKDAPGERIEDLNLLQPKFKEFYSGDDTATTFPLSFKELDDTPVIAIVDNVEKTETTDFTVDRVNGTVTFTAAPSKGVSNIEIIPSKTHAGYSDRVKKCRFNLLYSGSNDSRIFIWGNPDYQNYRIYSGMTLAGPDPSYFPDSNFEAIGSDEFPLVDMQKQYDRLIMYQPNKAYYSYYSYDGVAVIFPTFPLNDTHGSLVEGQIIDNNPFTIDSTGVIEWVSTNVRDERNAQLVSYKVNNSLLKENLQNAVTFDYSFLGEYWVCIGKKVWVLNYRNNAWYYFELHHNVKCIREIDSIIYFGDDAGNLFYFIPPSDPTDNPKTYEDDGESIASYWKSGFFDFGMNYQKKMVEKLFVSLKPDIRASVEIDYFTDIGRNPITFEKRYDIIDWGNIDWGNFTWNSNYNPQPGAFKSKVKKIVYFQLVLSNVIRGESMSILSVDIKWKPQSEVK